MKAAIWASFSAASQTTAACRPRCAHRLADGIWAAIGCNGRGLPVAPPRPFPIHDAAVFGVAATVATKRWLERVDMMRKH